MSPLSILTPAFMQILVFTLKRFQSRGVLHSSSKIDSFISFPIEGLDLNGYVLGENRPSEASASENPGLVYDLFAVSNHIGGIGGGHCMYSQLTDVRHRYGVCL